MRYHVVCGMPWIIKTFKLFLTIHDRRSSTTHFELYFINQKKSRREETWTTSKRSHACHVYSELLEKSAEHDDF